MSNILKVVVGAANIHDTVVGCDVFRSALLKYSSLGGETVRKLQITVFDEKIN